LNELKAEEDALNHQAKDDKKPDQTPKKDDTKPTTPDVPKTDDTPK
jgi:hypothetical protein